MNVSDADMNNGGDLQCPYCNSSSREVLGVDEERRMSRLRCRKCDAEYWENLATGMVQMKLDEAEK